MDPDRHVLSVRLLPIHPFHMNYIFEPVNASDFALTALLAPTDDVHFVVFADGDGADLSPSQC